MNVVERTNPSGRMGKLEETEAGEGRSEREKKEEGGQTGAAWERRGVGLTGPGW
jgi:hypothetical protein